MKLADFRDDWKVLDDLAEPANGGAEYLHTGGFVFGDTFNVFLRNISEDYLRAAWLRLSEILEQYNGPVNDLSWGWMHSGVTGFYTGETPNDGLAPGDFLGWVSCDLSQMWRTGQHVRLDELLRVGQPALRCTATYRSLKWRIAPDDFPLALTLIEALCTSDVVEWTPDNVLRSTAAPADLWHQVAAAIRDDDQARLDRVLEAARQQYTPLGFRILVSGYRGYLQGGAYEGAVRMGDNSD